MKHRFPCLKTQHTHPWRCPKTHVSLSHHTALACSIARYSLPQKPPSHSDVQGARGFVLQHSIIQLPGGDPCPETQESGGKTWHDRRIPPLHTVQWDPLLALGRSMPPLGPPDRPTPTDNNARLVTALGSTAPWPAGQRSHVAPDAPALAPKHMFRWQIVADLSQNTLSRTSLPPLCRETHYRGGGATCSITQVCGRKGGRLQSGPLRYGPANGRPYAGRPESSHCYWARLPIGSDDRLVVSVPAPRAPWHAMCSALVP